MKRLSSMTSSPRSLSTLGHAGLSLLLLASCDRTFVTNNYFSQGQDAGKSEGEETTDPSETIAGDAQVDSSALDAAVIVDATADSGVDAEPAPPLADAAPDVPDAGSQDDGGDGAVPVLALGVPVVNATLAEQQVNVFGTFNNHFWFVATPEQVDAINQEFQNGGGGGFWGGYGGGDIYAPNSGKDALNAVEHLVVTTPDGKTVDYGQMQVKLVGQSTGRPWTDATLPNFKLDADDITAGMRIGGYEHFRLNNAIIGTIFREKFVYDFYNALGYPAPLSSYAWVSTTVWDPSAKVPYIVTESYKRGFCKNRPELGGECPNMWEFATDFGYYGNVFEQPDYCQFEECDSTRATLFETAVNDAANGGETTLEDLSEYLDWNKFHEFHCLAWIFGTTDSPPLTSNNTLWAERADGKFQMFPYSIDISLNIWGQYWSDPGLYGGTTLANLCNVDEECWADTMAVCENTVAKFTAADPVGRLDQLHAELDAAGMLRSGDEGRYNDLRAVLSDMVVQLPVALETYREPRDPNSYNYCPFPLVDCGGYCQWVEDCYLCDDAAPEGDVPMGDPAPPPTVGEPTTAVADGGVPPIETDAGEVPTKPDFCYGYPRAQEVYVLP